MKAETRQFFALTPDTILEAVERAGFDCTGRCLALNSMENRVYEVEVETDGELSNPSERFRVAKFYRPGRWSREQILEEHQFLLDLAERELPVVPPIQDSAGETLHEAGELGIYYALFPKAGGRTPQELSDEELLMMGRLMARVHNVGAIRTALHRLAIGPATYGLENLDYLLSSDSLPSDLRSPYVEAVKTLCDEISPWFEGVATHRLHGDCHLGNVVWGSDGPRLVDFDDMVRGPAVQDLWLMIPGRDDYANRSLALLLEGYEQMRPFDRSTLRLIEPLRTLRLIHYSAWIARRWEDPSFKAAFPQFGTHGYWREQLGDLQDQIRYIRQASGMAPQAPEEVEEPFEWLD
jgi:Ser/Thr protein kinase RdoA (MazF antagonist)